MINKYTKWVTNHAKLIVITAILLLIPAFIGYKNTKINYDILIYLPEDIATMKGQEILTNDFEMGSFAFVTLDNIKNYELENLTNEIKQMPSVSNAISVADILDLSIPNEMLPEEIKSKIFNENKTVIAVTFAKSTSHDDTIKAIENIRKLVKDPSLVSGMTGTVLDTRDLSTKEMTAYILIAVIFCSVILIISTDSYIIPILLLTNIGISILYNMGTNIFLGEISYITKAIAAVLQLGVTMDFSIFLYHKFSQAKEREKDNKKAMQHALKDTMKSVLGSSFTTIAGFLALCFMNLTLGKDIGLVMAKGVIWGLICVFTLFPALLLVFDKLINKTKHSIWLPKFEKIQKFSLNHSFIIILIFIILLIPAIYGNSHVNVYYNLDESLPKDLPSSLANSNLKEQFNLVSPEVLILNKNLKIDDLNNLIAKLKTFPGVDLVISPKALTDFGLPFEMIPESLQKLMASDKYQVVIINSLYKTATNELNNQVIEISNLALEYDKDAILAGEGPLMKDLTQISATDFRNVNIISIAAIFIIMILVLKSFTLPIILVCTIEFAICLNIAFAFFTNESLPFIASIIIGTIQLGATIDYAILMTSKFQEESRINKDIKKAMEKTLAKTVPSIITSALCFFAATIGVSIYSKIDMIGSICKLLSRGSIISMLVVIIILPAFLLLEKKIFKKKEEKNMKKNLALLTLLTLCFFPTNTKALVKQETIYTNLNFKGEVTNKKVINHLFQFDSEKVKDETELKNILNINSNETYLQDGNLLTWPNYGKDIFYEGTTQKELPINVKITYTLNDEEMSLEDILGKEGKVTIKLSFQNNTSQKVNINGKMENLYTPFIITAGTIIKNDHNWNVSINNGKVVNTGSKNIVVGLSASGVYESLNLDELKSLTEITISYETNKMSLNNIYLVMTPKLIEENDLTIFNKLNNIYSDMTKLQDNMNLIAQNTKELEKGALSMKNGSKNLSSSLSTVVQNLKNLQTGSTTLEQGLKTTIASLETAKKQIETNDQTTSLKSLKELNNKNTETIQTLTKTNNSLETNYLTYKLNSLTIEQIISSSYDEETKTKLVTLKQTYEGNQGLITLLNTNNQAINQMITELTKIYKQLNDLLISLQNGLSKLQNGASKINTGLNTLSNGINQIYLGSKSLSDGSASLYDGTAALTKGIDKFNKEGIETLSMTSNKIKNETDKVKELIKLGENYQGFGSNNTNDSAFVFMVESKS